MPPFERFREIRLNTAVERLAKRLGTRTVEEKQAIRVALTDFEFEEREDLARGSPAPTNVRVCRDPEYASAGYIEIPYDAKAEKYLPLRRALNRTAEECKAGPYTVAFMMSFFLQWLADEVSAGHVVRIPGFGMFVATWYDSGKSSPFPQPRFIPSRQFRQQTTAMCPKDRAIVNADAATTYRRSHHPSSKPDRAASFVSSAMFALRDQWKHQPACPIG